MNKEKCINENGFNKWFKQSDYSKGKSMNALEFTVTIDVWNYQQEKIDKLESALNFYADIENNTQDNEGERYGWDEEFMGCDSFRHDNGDIAKEALGLPNNL